MTRLGRKTIMAGVAVLAAAGLSVTAPPAQAAGSYNIKLANAGSAGTGFVADYCLLTTTSGNSKAACTGNKSYLSNIRMGVVHTPGDRVWMDINIVAGGDLKGIDLQGKHYITVSGLIGSVHVCGWKSEASYLAGNEGLDLHGRGPCHL